MTACRPQPGQSGEPLLFSKFRRAPNGSRAGRTAPFVPNWFVDIRCTLETKMQALRAYDTRCSRGRIRAPTKA